MMVNFVSCPRTSSVKSSSTFFPTIACPKGEFMVITRGYKSNSNSIGPNK